MPKSIILFLKKTYKVFSVFIAVAVFFLFYNTYLVDRSLVNLRVALNKAAQAQTVEDFEKIRPLLKVPLFKEISKTTVSNKTLMSIEAVENTTTTAKEFQQIEDIKFYLKTIIEAKEKERGGFLAALDRLNSRIFAPEVGLSPAKLEAKVKDLLAKIASTKDRGILQELYYDLGNLYVQLSNLSGAENTFLKTEELNPGNPLAIKARFNLAWAYKSMGEYEKAVACFEKLAKEFPEIDLAITSKYEAADTLYKKGEYQEARDRYALLASEHPKFEGADIALSQAGYISLYNLNDKDATLKYFSELEEKFSQTETAKHAMTKGKEAIAGDFRHGGYELLKEKKYPEAIENFKKAVEIAPLDGRSLSGMSLGFYWIDEKQEAQNLAQKAIEVKPEDGVTLTNFLFIYINSQQIDEAIKTGEETLAKVLIKRPEFYYNLGYAYVLKANIDAAVIQFDRAISLNPDFVFAYNNLGCSFWSIGKYSEAINMFKKAIDRDPEYADTYFNLGVAYFHVNQLEEACGEFKKVLKIDPTYKQAESYLQAITAILKYQP